MKKNNPIFEGIAKAVISTAKLAEAKLNQTVIEQIVMESTLSRLIGDSPGGQNLVRWLHNHDKLSNTADYDETPVRGQRIQWQMFKENPDHFLIVSGSNGVVGIKPSKEHIDAGYAQKGSKYNPSRDNNLPYQVVAFRKDQRVDNLLIPDPEDPRRKKVLNPDAAPTIITARGGVPSVPDPRGTHNIFDQMKEAIGSLQTIYIASRRSENIPKRDVKGYVRDYKSGNVPEKSISGGPRSQHDRAIDMPGSVERGKLARRRPTAQSYNLQHEMQKIIRKLGPSLRRIADQAIAIRSQKGEDPKKLASIRNAISEIESGNGSLLIMKALQTASGLDPKSQEFADWVGDLNSGPVQGYAPVINAIRRELM